jgi:hypothetical protein
MAAPDGKRGLLKPENRLQWPGAAPLAKLKAASAPLSRTKRPQGLPSNAIPQAQFTLEQLKKMAALRGLSVEKLLAQMVQQYLKEE